MPGILTSPEGALHVAQVLRQLGQRAVHGRRAKQKCMIIPRAGCCQTGARDCDLDAGNWVTVIDDGVHMVEAGYDTCKYAADA